MIKRIRLHIFFWVLISGVIFGVTSEIMPFDKAILITLINVCFYMLVYYTNTLYLFPKYYQETHNIKYILLVLMLIIVATFSIYKIELYIADQFERVPKLLERPTFLLVARSFFWLLLIVVIGSVYLIQKRLRKHLLYHKEIQEDKLKTELKLLKSQINPHFLFNAMNNIYSLSHMKSDKAPESILKLSSMLRYVIEDCVTETVPLKSEIEYLENYIAFQKMKSPDIMNINFKYDQLDLHLKVAPMLFIPFLENSFKYSKIEEFQNAYINIEIKSVKNGKFIFSIYNSIPPTTKTSPGAGTGINNVKTRLNIIYPNKHLLTIEETKDTYRALLNIETNET